MTQATSRPALGGQHTRKTEEKRAAELDSGISITLGGEAYVVRRGDITPAVARRFRKAAGYSTNALFEEFAADPDVDTFASFVWLARIIEGEEVELDDVVIDLGLLDDDFDVKVVDRAGGEVDLSDPEA